MFVGCGSVVEAQEGTEKLINSKSYLSTVVPDVLNEIANYLIADANPSRGAIQFVKEVFELNKNRKDEKLESLHLKFLDRSTLLKFTWEKIEKCGPSRLTFLKNKDHGLGVFHLSGLTKMALGGKNSNILSRDTVTNQGGYIFYEVWKSKESSYYQLFNFNNSGSPLMSQLNINNEELPYPIVAFSGGDNELFGVISKVKNEGGYSSTTSICNINTEKKIWKQNNSFTNLQMGCCWAESSNAESSNKAFYFIENFRLFSIDINGDKASESKILVYADNNYWGVYPKMAVNKTMKIAVITGREEFLFYCYDLKDENQGNSEKSFYTATKVNVPISEIRGLKFLNDTTLAVNGKAIDGKYKLFIFDVKNKSLIEEIPSSDAKHISFKWIAIDNETQLPLVFMDDTSTVCAYLVKSLLSAKARECLWSKPMQLKFDMSFLNSGGTIKKVRDVIFEGELVVQTTGDRLYQTPIQDSFETSVKNPNHFRFLYVSLCCGLLFCLSVSLMVWVMNQVKFGLYTSFLKWHTVLPKKVLPYLPALLESVVKL